GPGVSFTLDIQAPASQITSPLEEVLPSLSAVTGTATDNLSGVANVRISIQRQSDNAFWNGNFWVTTQTPLNAVGTTSWSYTWPSLGDNTYLIYSRATDMAANQETPGDSVTFTIDTSLPASTITSPQSGVIYSAFTTITGTAADNRGVNKVEISIRRHTDDRYWIGSNWVPAETWLTAAGTTDWTYPWPIVNEGTYTIRSRATDNSGNVEIPGLGVTFI
ncbi:MAG: Ig-like domain-containing protein, partial [bacterium]|nr:Ig-like domain-containing protein [bacterium]